MFLEAQFGQAITPIAKPKLSSISATSQDVEVGVEGVKQELSNGNGDEENVAGLEAAELSRLHNIGIPVPGVEVRIDKYVAKIWMESLEVECASQVFAQRVKAVVDRAVETVAPLWTESNKHT